jgi:hypothetical protein
LKFTPIFTSILEVLILDPWLYQHHKWCQLSHTSLQPKETTSTHHTNVAKLVCPSHSVIVEEASCSHPSGVGVISKDNELVLITLIANPDETFLNVRYNYPVPNCLDSRYVIGNMLEKKQEQ